VSKYWQFVREAIADPKSDTGLPSFDAGRLMSFDISPGYLAEVAAERQRIEDEEDHKKLLEAQTQSVKQFVQQPWDIGAGDDRATKKGPKKSELHTVMRQWKTAYRSWPLTMRRRMTMLPSIPPRP
jgi:hypothetical protein